MQNLITGCVVLLPPQVKKDKNEQTFCSRADQQKTGVVGIGVELL